MKTHIAYTLSQKEPVLHTKFHGNRFSHSPVMPAQTDRQKRISKNRKLQEIFGLQIYIYKDYVMCCIRPIISFLIHFQCIVNSVFAEGFCFM